jgi:hypothetical protein
MALTDAAVCRAAASKKQNTARAAGEVTAQGKNGAPDTQTNKKRWREMTGQKKKKVTGTLARQWRSDRTQKCCATKEKGAARQKGQVTDLRPVKKVLRD